MAAEGMKRQAEVVADFRGLGQPFGGLTQQRDRAFQLALLGMDHAEELKRTEMPGVAIED